MEVLMLHHTTGVRHRKAPGYRAVPLARHAIGRVRKSKKGLSQAWTVSVLKGRSGKPVLGRSSPQTPTQDDTHGPVFQETREPAEKRHCLSCPSAAAPAGAP